MQLSSAAAAGSEPGDEVLDDFACAGPGVEIDVDVPLRHLRGREVVLIVEPEEELAGLGDLLLRVPGGKVEVVRGIGGEGMESFE